MSHQRDPGPPWLVEHCCGCRRIGQQAELDCWDKCHWLRLDFSCRFLRIGKHQRRPQNHRHSPGNGIWRQPWSWLQGRSCGNGWAVQKAVSMPCHLEPSKTFYEVQQSKCLRYSFPARPHRLPIPPPAGWRLCRKIWHSCQLLLLRWWQIQMCLCPQGAAVASCLSILQLQWIMFLEVLYPMSSNWRQLLLWICLRCLARWTLPVAEGTSLKRQICWFCLKVVNFSSERLCGMILGGWTDDFHILSPQWFLVTGLVQRLSYLDFGEERGQRTSPEASGAAWDWSQKMTKLKPCGQFNDPTFVWMTV